jgi:hypothetical protein
MTPAAPSASQGRFRSFADFYPFYLSEHRDPVCRRLHFIGTVLVIASLLAAALTGRTVWLLGVPLAGYGFAWVGHFFFEHNRPRDVLPTPGTASRATFVMFRDMLVGRSGSDA